VDSDYRSSLYRRIAAVHSLYYDACSSMTIEQVNAVTHQSTLPIAFSLVHQLLMEDGSLVFVGGPAPQFDDNWAQRLDLGVSDHGKEKTVEEMMAQRIGNYEAFLEFQVLVFRSTETYVADIDPAILSDVLIHSPYGPALANTFSARVGGEHGITRSDALECWIYQHALRHMGEIEHARSLVGLGGMTS
jgi:hypothetical protein